jgi:hypothetical protein
MKEEPKALIMDNLGAHLSQSVMERCRDYNIRYWYGMVPTGTYWLCTVPTLPTYLRYLYGPLPVPVPVL